MTNWIKDKNQRLLFYGCILSLAAILILFGVRIYAPFLLDIDIKWLIVASIPIVLALIVGKFITRFKWMGVDIEIAVDDRIVDAEDVVYIMHSFIAQKKENLAVLFSLSPEAKNRPNVLAFEQGKPGYYDPYAIREYVRLLPNVHFFSVKTSTGKFVALLQINRELILGQANELINSFILDLAENRIPEEIGFFVITHHIVAKTKVIDAYEIIKRTPNKALTVLENEESKQLIGIVFERSIEAYLAKLVLRYVKGKEGGTTKQEERG